MNHSEKGVFLKENELKFFNVITRKSGDMLQQVSRDIRNVYMLSHNYRKLNDRQSRYINRQVVKTQLASTRQIFKVCNMLKLSLATCCKVLQGIATNQKSKTMSPLNLRQIQENAFLQCDTH